MDQSHRSPANSIPESKNTYFAAANDTTMTTFHNDPIVDASTPQAPQLDERSDKIPVPPMILPSTGAGIKPEAPITRTSSSPCELDSQSTSVPGPAHNAIVVPDRVDLLDVSKGFVWTKINAGNSSIINASQSRTVEAINSPTPVISMTHSTSTLEAASVSLITGNEPELNDNESRPQGNSGSPSSFNQDGTSSLCETELSVEQSEVPDATGQGKKTKKKPESKHISTIASRTAWRRKHQSKPVINMENIVELTDEESETAQDEVTQGASHRGGQIGPRAESLNTSAPVDRTGSPTGSLAPGCVDSEAPVPSETAMPPRPTARPRSQSDYMLGIGRFSGPMHHGIGANEGQLGDLDSEDEGLRSRPTIRSTRPFLSQLPRGHSAAACSRAAGAPEINDIEIVHSILDGKFRRAQQLEDELAQMQDVIFDIDNKLGSIFERDQDANRLRDRCMRLQDALNEYREKYTGATEEVSKLRFQLQAAHDELKRKELNMSNQIARESDKLDLSNRIIRQLRTYNEASREGFLELEAGYKGLKAELADVLEERAKLKSRIRERDHDIEDMKASIEKCERALQDQRGRYEALRQKCVDADSIAIMNGMLRVDLDNARSDLIRERDTIASLETTLKAMTAELEALRSTMRDQHDTVTGGVDSNIATLAQLVASQQEGFQEFRAGISRLQGACENPESELFKTLDNILKNTDAKWSGVSETVTSLQKQQETERQSFSEKAGKWKALKETLTGQIQDLTRHINNQDDAIRKLTGEKDGIRMELERQKELNRCLIDTTNKEKELNDLKLAEASHKIELLEGTKREYLVRNSLLESTVRTLESKVEAEKRQFEAEKKKLQSEHAKTLADLQGLQAENKEATSTIEELTSIKSELQHATSLAADLKECITGEKKKSSEAREEVRTLREQLQIKNEQLGLAASRWTDISVKQARLEEIAAAAKAEAQLRAEEAESHRDDLNATLSKVTELEVESGRKSNLLKKLEDDIETSKSELKDISTRHEILQKTLDHSKQLCNGQLIAIQAKDETILKLEELLESANSNIKRLEETLSEQSKELENEKERSNRNEKQLTQVALDKSDPYRKLQAEQTPQKNEPASDTLIAKKQKKQFQQAVDCKVKKPQQLRRSKRGKAIQLSPKQIEELEDAISDTSTPPEKRNFTLNKRSKTSQGSPPSVQSSDVQVPATQVSMQNPSQPPTPAPQGVKRTFNELDNNPPNHPNPATQMNNDPPRKRARVRAGLAPGYVMFTPSQCSNSSPQAALTYNAAKQKGVANASDVGSLATTSGNNQTAATNLANPKKK